jgi:uncharacterized protein (DUF433 family)
MASLQPTSSFVHVVRNPEICGGKPCINGTRIRVQDIYVWFEEKSMTADDIVARYPQLSHADVYAALAYCWDHRAEIMNDVRADDDLAERLRIRFESKLS